MIQQYMENKYGEPKDFPRRTVTTEEFVRVRVALGETEEEARLQAKLTKGMGSYCLVGREWLEIKDDLLPD